MKAEFLDKLVQTLLGKEARCHWLLLLWLFNFLGKRIISWVRKLWAPTSSSWGKGHKRTNERTEYWILGVVTVITVLNWTTEKKLCLYNVQCTWYVVVTDPHPLIDNLPPQYLSLSKNILRYPPFNLYISPTLFVIYL